MPKLARRLVVLLGVSAAGMGVCAGGLYWAARQVPDFYEQSLAQPIDREQPGGERFEQQALALHNQLQHEGRWKVRFTEDEINGWLANDLPVKFPRLLPPGASDPRVAIDGSTLRMAVRYQRGNVNTVLSLAGEGYLTEEPNEIAIRIRHVRAGLLPVPLSRLLGDISARAGRAGVPLRWTEAEGAPVALVRVPTEIAWSKNEAVKSQQLVLEQLQLADGALVAAGRVEATHAGDAELPTAAIQSADSETRQR